MLIREIMNARGRAVVEGMTFKSLQALRAFADRVGDQVGVDTYVNIYRDGSAAIITLDRRDHLIVELAPGSFAPEDPPPDNARLF